MRHIPGAADVHVQQLLDLPTLHLNIERDPGHAGWADGAGRSYRACWFR
jgi:hypothetical protein